MTAFLNKIQLIGHLGTEPKTITCKSGQSLVTATLATNESFKIKEERHTRVEWHQLVFFGSLTKVTDYLKKGSLVFVEGKLRSNPWTDEDGNNRHSISIVVSNIQCLGQEKANQAPTNVADSHIANLRDMLQDNTVDVPF
ncbi:single-strand DNA-binding protein [Legionella busanensis]|uniref:Single-stranded DNA-binding protein n=1 Tax=Legionella busanensis TaxID=190655 RepID=A0A378JLD5_9GAMM|nr:single-stranded DNA-binding protein [Legionella busanensis]STX50910.1 single-strand DNA-binding protein [Legionella busanensis]